MLRGEEMDTTLQVVRRPRGRQIDTGGRKCLEVYFGFGGFSVHHHNRSYKAQKII